MEYAVALRAATEALGLTTSSFKHSPRSPLGGETLWGGGRAACLLFFWVFTVQMEGWQICKDLLRLLHTAFPIHWRDPVLFSGGPNSLPVSEEQIEERDEIEFYFLSWWLVCSVFRHF